MSLKLGRNFKLTVQVSDSEFVEINYPLTINFDISRNTLAQANTGTFSIVNLAEKTRKQIYHDRYQTLDYRHIKFQAGYEDMVPLPVCFQGDIRQASSVRKGTDFVTTIEAFDGGFAMMNAQTSVSAPAGTNMRDILGSILQAMAPQNVQKGAVGGFSGQSERGFSAAGNAWEIANRLASADDGYAYIDNEVANALKVGEYVKSDGETLRVNAQTGLLGTPVRFNGRVNCDMLFEPRIRIGQSVILESSETANNGRYQVIGVRHRGTISGAVGGDCRTTLTLWVPGKVQLSEVAP